MIAGPPAKALGWGSIKKAAALTLLILCAVALAACSMPTRYSIEDLQNIMVVGIDLQEDKIMITAVVDTMQKGKEAESVQTGTKIYIAEGQTVFEAKRALHQMVEKHVTWNQLKYIIIGENAARQGIDRLLTFF